MSEELSLPRILPIGAIVFETLFLLIAIAIEGYVLNRSLKFDKKTSIFYAIAMNVFSSVIGWNIFFLVEPILDVQLKSELMSYIFFNNFKRPSTQSSLIVLGLLIFIGTFLVKLHLLKILIISLSEGGKKEISDSSQREKLLKNEKIKLQNANLITTTLIANSMSYTAITLILVIRNFSIATK
ncbi:filament integrity protein fraC [Sphaerospermopsis aphanizomenoides BCCUSP55]|uniref:filament integrity protein FraC n=1 Tax=Sphaerospermopsis aphanizomenoides TaxID=459663 RepID=UPI001906B58F|nr:filament integrity protein FraC [Sphaerospermopsis aphanizomenoides]MBK1986409.1 filament integrity protein fraC [Sphaerospermopsis aphanizomenoides BCCUSP55]